jgi:hypothetical protein
MDSMGLSKEAILKALQDLSDGLAARNVKGELCLFGGTVMVLAFAARTSQGRGRRFSAHPGD